MTAPKITVIIFTFMFSIGCGIVENKSNEQVTNGSNSNKTEQNQPVQRTSTIATQEETTKAYYENGQLKSEGIYRNGKKERLHKEWTKEGILMLEGEYRNGKANGLMIWYHGEGHMAAKGSMVNDQRHGPWTICGITPNEPCISANFTYEIRTGIWKIFHENGRLAREQTWKADTIQYQECWDKAGKKIKCIGHQ